MCTPIPVGPGVVFWPLPTEQVPEPHPWVVISGIVAGKVLTVNVTDRRNCPNSPCFLEVREHECITIPSAIFYGLFRERDASLMGRALARGTGLNHCSNLSPELLTRIITGFKACKDVRNSIKVKYGFIPAEPSSRHPF